jgi:hypothetical protein
LIVWTLLLYPNTIQRRNNLRMLSKIRQLETNPRMLHLGNAENQEESFCMEQ